ncbi:MAG TPA: BatA domain-containing protein [Tepidisphaeraceae bacterium]|nr:BatA domain-containing protein [Tepidisphaeraceae bacterium]
MTFLMGWAILGVGMLAAAIPIVIHLLHRQRTTPIRWGAMQFLLESPLKSKRRKKVEHWLLMAARVAALLLLAWALSRPLVQSSHYNPLAGKAPVDIAVVVDHSLSTGRRSGDHTVFDEERGAVQQIASAMRRGDTLSVILAEHQPRSLAAAPASARDVPGLLQALAQLKPGLTDCSIPQAIDSARAFLDHGRNARKLVIVASDEQKTNWQIGQTPAWSLATTGPADQPSARLPVHTLAVPADNSASDVAIGDISIEPHLVGINRPIQITSSINNIGARDVSGINIHLTMDGQDAGPPMHLERLGVGQSSTIHFDHTFSLAGSHWIRIWTDLIDSLPADNSSVASVQVWQKLPVLIIDGQLTSAGSFSASQFLAAAMQPVDLHSTAPTLIQPKIVSAADSSREKLDDYDVVVLNDVAQLPPDVEGRLLDYADSGHGVWVILGPRSQESFITQALGPGRARLTRLSLKGTAPINASAPPALVIRSAANPMIAMIAASERNALVGAVVKQWWPVVPGDGDDQTVLATADGQPLVFEHPVGGNGGRVIVWATSADAAWNNWPAMPNFVPLVNETIYHACAPQTSLEAQGSVPAGGAISWSGPANPAVQSVSITLPDGSIERDRAATFRNGHWEFQYPNTFLPGLYQMRFMPTGVPQPAYFGVGIDRRELDPATLTAKDHQWLHDNKFADEISLAQLPSLIAQNDRGAELWKWLAVFVLGSLMLETLLTWRMVSLQKSVGIMAGQSTYGTERRPVI